MRKKQWILVAVVVLGLAVPWAAAGELCGEEPDASDAAPDRSQGRLQVGEVVRWTSESPEITTAGLAKAERLVWTETISYPGASYIAPHFSYFNLPEGARVVIRSPGGWRSWEYRGTGKGDRGLKEGFWGIHIQGDTAIVELLSEVTVPAGAVVIDSFARGFAPKSLAVPPKALCGPDNSEWAPCYEQSVPEVYYTSRPVARLLIEGQWLCTGWLVGSAGHLMTNEHCIEDEDAAMDTNYEFMAEGATCETPCNWALACGGTIVADHADLIQVDYSLDYSLVELPVNPTGTYGFLQMRDRGTAIGERIYIPQHPQGWGKRIALYSTHAEDTSGYCEVQSVTRPPCHGGPGDVGYFCDTQGGSSGSPVLGLCDNAVVSLHHCGTCPNRGVPIVEVIADLGANLPPNSVSTSSWHCDDCGPGFCLGGRFCDKLGCYPADSSISRAFCLCGLLDPGCGFGYCVGPGPNYATGSNCEGAVCYIDDGDQSLVMCQEAELDANCEVN